jgi:hypothetical protein
MASAQRQQLINSMIIYGPRITKIRRIVSKEEQLATQRPGAFISIPNVGLGHVFLREIIDCTTVPMSTIMTALVKNCIKVIRKKTNKIEWNKACHG